MRQVTRKDLSNALRQAILPEDEFIIVQSNIFSFGRMNKPLEEITGAFLDVLLPHQTLILPTFTFSFCKTGQYDFEQTPSETGVLTEYFRKQPGVLRTACPINSYAVYGAKAKEMANLPQSPTCWGKESIYHFFYQRNVRILGLGEKLGAVSAIFHYVEEKELVPYRFFKTFSGKANFGEGMKEVSKKMYVRPLDIPVNYEYFFVIDDLIKKEKFKRIPFGASFIETMYVRDAVDVLTERIQKDSLVSLSNRKEYEDAISRTTISFLGSSNLDLTTKIFAQTYREFLNKDCHVIPVAFNQYKQQILDPASPLRNVDPSYVVFLERIEDLLGAQIRSLTNPEYDRDQIIQAVNHYAGFIQQSRKVLKGKFLIANFETMIPSPLANVDKDVEYGYHQMIVLANQLLREKIEGLADVYLFDYQAALLRCGADKAFSQRYWYIGKIAFTNEFSKLLSKNILGLMLSMEGKTSRLIVVDLDNTLWGGAIGDDGVQGIYLNNDYPGNIYKDIQLFLSSMTKRGIALAVCSKNTQEIVLSALQEHQDMILKKEDFAAIRINWEDKSANIRSICEELSLGTYSVLFMDDNPVEREMVKRHIPDCIVVDLPPNVSEWINFLATHPYLQMHQLTKEDLKRNKQYAQKANIEQIKGSFDNLDDFFAAMGMRITIEPYRDANRLRVEQLIAKTNQFNTTTKRYGQKDLEGLLKKGAKVFAVHYQDKMFESEIIGVMIVVPADFKTYTLDSFILSCRILGRKIETALLGWLVQWAAEAGAEEVIGEFRITDKNKPVQSLFVSHGFEAIPGGNYKYHLKRSKPIDIPACIAIQEKIEASL